MTWWPRRSAACARTKGVSFLLGLVLAIAVSTAFLGYPLAIEAFDRPVRVAEAAQAALAHVSTGLLGAQLARLATPPLVRRRASAAVVVALAVLASVVADARVAPLAGPMSVSGALADGAAPRLLAACLTCLLAAGAIQVARGFALRRWG